MKSRILKTLFFIFFYAIPIVSYAATYEYYFSNDNIGHLIGSDANGNGSINNPWKSLSKAQNTINLLKSTDTMYLYFDRGDTWTCDTEKLTTSNLSCLEINSQNPTVHIDAYGTGADPTFDGLVTDFATVDYDQSNGTYPVRWSRFFFFNGNDNSSVKNVEIKGVYGYGIALKDSHYFTLSHSTIHDVGGPAIGVIVTGLHNSAAEYNTIYNAQQLYRNAKQKSWGGGVQFGVETATGETYNNTISHNTIYDVYGECIWAPGSTIEYNVIGSCGSAAIYAVPHDQDLYDTAVRYNYITFEDYSQSDYDRHRGGMRTCFAVFDEALGGNNNSATLDISGNVCINYERGLTLECVQGSSAGQPQCDDAAKIGAVTIHDNLIIDPLKQGVFCNLVDGPITDDFSFYNNSILVYDNAILQLVDDRAYGIPAGWASGITGNHYYQKTGSLPIDTDWDTLMSTTDPELLGEPATAWNGQVGATYYKDINPILHLNPSSDYLINNLSPILSMDINDITRPQTLGISPPVNFIKTAN